MRPVEVSVVMSVFNGARYVAAAVESILRQSFADFEFVIVDDGSTDDSAKILERFASQDSRVRLLQLPNGGLTRALNVGIHAAHGELIARMDADDVAVPERLAEQIVFLRRHQQVVVVGCALLLIDPDGDPLAVRSYPTTHPEIESRLLDGDGVIPHPSALLRRDAWIAVGGYREQFPYAQDLDLWLRFAETGRLANLEQPLLKYRLHSDAISTRHRGEQLRWARQAVSDARRRRGMEEHDEVLQGIEEHDSAAKILRGWSRMAMRNGNVAVARKHALAALRQAPFSPSNLGLAARLFFPISRKAS